MSTSNLEGEYQQLLVAPHSLKPRLLELMDGEIEKARRGEKARIFIKVNSVTDRQLIDKLAQASQAGVSITMNVRGICCLLPELPGKTENIHITSIVGRFLEHSRIYCFGQGSQERMYIASADFMTRNTERRVEVGVRVDDPAIAKKLRGILDLQLRDTVNAREMQPDGTYTKVHPAEGQPPVDSQMAMFGYFKDGFEMHRKSQDRSRKQPPSPRRQPPKLW